MRGGCEGCQTRSSFFYRTSEYTCCVCVSDNLAFADTEQAKRNRADTADTSDKEHKIRLPPEMQNALEQGGFEVDGGGNPRQTRRAHPAIHRVCSGEQCRQGTGATVGIQRPRGRRHRGERCPGLYNQGQRARKSRNAVDTEERYAGRANTGQWAEYSESEH